MPGPFTPRKPNLSKSEMRRRRGVFFAALAAAADDSGDGGNGTGPASLGNYVIGIEASSYDDPGGGGARRANFTTVTNLAPDGPGLTPHFIPGNYPVLHTGAWTGLANWDDIPDPNGEDWWSCNQGIEDASFPNLSEWEVDLSELLIGPEHSMIIVATHPLNQGGQLYRPLYGGDGVNRLEWNTGTGQVSLRTPVYGPTLQTTIGDMRGGWYVYGFSRGQGSLAHWFNGNALPVAAGIAGATGDMGFNLAGYGTAPDGGIAALHVWMEEHSEDDLLNQMEILATRFGISFGVS